MTIRESNKGDDYTVSINLSAKNGDRVRVFERNLNQADVPLMVCYNLGLDFGLRTDAEKRTRVIAMLKMLQAAIQDVVEDVGAMVGAKGPQLPRHEVGESGGPGFGGRRVQ